MNIEIIKNIKSYQQDLTDKTCLLIDVFNLTTTIPLLLSNNINKLYLSERSKNIDKKWLKKKNYLIISDKNFKNNIKNSPFDFMFDNFKSKNIILKIDNTIKLINKLHQAREVYCGSYVNFSSLSNHLKKRNLDDLLIFPYSDKLQKKKTLENYICANAYKQFLIQNKINKKKINFDLEKSFRKKIINFKGNTKQKEMKLFADFMISSSMNLTDLIPIIKFKKKYIYCEKI